MGIRRRLKTVLQTQELHGQKLDTLLQRLEQLMAVTEDTKALVGKLNDATNAVAAEVKTLQDRIPVAGSVITEADAREIDAGLQSVIDRLTVMGQDPVNPIPPAPTPAPQAAPKAKRSL